jgi:hypothetical protein
MKMSMQINPINFRLMQVLSKQTVDKQMISAPLHGAKQGMCATNDDSHLCPSRLSGENGMSIMNGKCN